MSGGARHGGGDTYWPALDGVRGIAILTVITYHLGHLPGGWVSLDVFFVMSGFLITSLIMRDRERTGRVVTARFWGRRARRLLPAVFTLLLFLGLYAWAGGPGLVPAQLRSPALATFFYVANWQQIVAGHDYFAQFTSPSPLLHTWSLAIEEQYYLAWPLLLALVVRLFPDRRRAALVVTGLAAVSAVWMGVAFHLYGANLSGVNRVYLGTDTRAWELLIGSAAGLWWYRAPSEREQRWWRRATVAGTAALIGFVVVSGGPPSWVWDGGLVAAGVASLGLIVGSVRAPTGVVARLLSLRPVRWVGKVSYSLYLWHWPVIVLMNQTTTGLAGVGLLVARVAAMAAATCVSYYLIESPLRRADWSAWRRRALAPIGAALTAAVVVAGTAAPAAAGTAVVKSAPPPHSAALSLYLPPGRVPTAADPLRIWIFGDSVMHDSESGVAAAFAATGRAQVVVDSSFGGWGLSTDTVWPSDANRIITEYKPEVAIGTWSWDDALAAGGPKAYLARLHRALATILTPGDGVDDVVLLGYPPAGPSPIITDPTTRLAAWRHQSAIQLDWDALAAKVVTGFPGHAGYLTTTATFAPGGRVMTWMRTADGTWIRARKLDFTHMCPYGAALLGAQLVGELGPTFHLGPLRAGWESGPWIHDIRYNDPPGACPDDQPPPGYRGVALPAAAAGAPAEAG